MALDFYTTYSEYFKENVRIFDALDFIAELTQHVPHRGVQPIRHYGLCSSRTKDRWEQISHISRRAPTGRQQTHGQKPESDDGLGSEPLPETVEVDAGECKQAWARLLAKVYGVDPFVCPIRGSEMKVIAVIQDTEGNQEFFFHLVRHIPAESPVVHLPVSILLS